VCAARVTNNENGHYEIYHGSKTALNMSMRSFAARHADDPKIPKFCRIAIDIKAAGVRIFKACLRHGRSLGDVEPA
jgi:hypothetical protein